LTESNSYSDKRQQNHLKIASKKMTTSNLSSESSHNPDDLLKQPQRYPNLRAGGRDLALRLESYRGTPDLVVLGIALGGLLVAHEVATHLGAPLDFVINRRLLATPEVGSHHTAVSVAGSLVIDDEIKLSAHPSSPIEHFLAEAVGGLEKRERTCRRGRPPLALAGKNVLLVDCGIRTGSTMKVAIRALRKVAPKQIIGAVPVASREGFALIANLCDELISLAQPEQFVNAGYWYRDFRRPGDEQVGDLLTD
jgi:putative phosphoribosyl transferase